MADNEPANRTEEQKPVKIEFDEEMPTTDLKKIYTVPVKMDKQLLGLVEKIESLTEKMGYTNIESMERITTILSELRGIIARIPAGNKEIIDKLAGLEQRIDGLQLEEGIDYSKLDRLENKFQGFGEKLDSIENQFMVFDDKIDSRIQEFDEKLDSAMADEKIDGRLQELDEKLDVVMADERVSNSMEQLSNRLRSIENRIETFHDIEDRLGEMGVDKQRIINIENRLDELAAVSIDIFKLLQGMSFEQIREKLELLTEIDKRARNLEEVVTELADVSDKETIRFDRLDSFIDKTTIESENLREAVDEMRKFIDEFKSKSSKKEQIIKKKLDNLNENVNALLDRFVIDALQDGDKRLLELESATGISSDILLKRLKALAEIRVRLRGEGTDLLCTLIR